MRQTLRDRRGHDFLPPKEVWDAIPTIEDRPDCPLGEVTIHVHYFAAFGDWWISAMDPETEDGEVLAHGFVRLSGFEDCAEWGDVLLNEIEAMRHSGLFIVERDLYWKPKPFSEVKR